MTTMLDSLNQKLTLLNNDISNDILLFERDSFFGMIREARISEIVERNMASLYGHVYWTIKEKLQ